MNYKKLITNRLSGLTHHSSGKSEAVVALLAGLAVGAVIGVLFAPDSGKATRERISDKALDLADNAKDSLVSFKEKINTGKESLIGLKDRAVDAVKSKVDQTTQEFKEFRDSELGNTATIDGEESNNA